MRLIDADALINTLNKEKIEFNADINYFILNAPTIDAEPVRHGHWEFIGGYGYQYRCSNCVRCAEHRTNYCPSCGSKMELNEVAEK